MRYETIGHTFPIDIYTTLHSALPVNGALKGAGPQSSYWPQRILTPPGSSQSGMSVTVPETKAKMTRIDEWCHPGKFFVPEKMASIQSRREGGRIIKLIKFRLIPAPFLEALTLRHPPATAGGQNQVYGPIMHSYTAQEMSREILDGIFPRS